MSSSHVLVLGSGVIGLHTARALIHAGKTVTIRASSSPLLSDKIENASVGAGGLWMPIFAKDPRITRWATTTLNYYLEVNQATPNSAVEIVPTLSFLNNNDSTDTYATPDTNSYIGPSDAPDWAHPAALNFQSLTPFQLKWQATVTKQHVPEQLVDTYDKCWSWDTPIVDSPRALAELMDEIRQAGGEINHESTFCSPEDVYAAAKADNAGTVVNCLGGAGTTLIGEAPVTFARGALKLFTRREGFNTCIIADDEPFGTPTHPIYAIPRGNLVAVGGTYLEDDHEINIRPEEEDKLRANAKLILPDEGEGFEEVGGWVGFRPLRKGGVNLGVNEEMSDKSGLKWIDNFGHGGSGWTVCTGCADDVVELAA